jgi:hypothetical protein
VAEAGHHRSVFLARTAEPAIDLDLRLLTAGVEAELHDLAGDRVGIFRPRALRHARTAAHIALHWDGLRMTHWYEKRQPHELGG